MEVDSGDDTDGQQEKENKGKKRKRSPSSTNNSTKKLNKSKGQQNKKKPKLISQTVICEICQLEFKGKNVHQRFNKHKLVKHTSKEEQEKHLLPCNLCGFKTLYRFNLNKHIANMHGEQKKFNCDVENCGYGTNELTNFNRHKILRHTSKEEQEEKVVSCTLCDYKTLFRGNLPRHMNIKHGKGKKFNCDIENREYGTNDMNASRLHKIVKHVSKEEEKQEPFLLRCFEFDTAIEIARDLGIFGEINNEVQQMVEPNAIYNEYKIVSACANCRVIIEDKNELDLHVMDCFTYTELLQSEELTVTYTVL